MTISKAIADFAEMLETKRTELAGLNAKVDQLKRDRDDVATASPHSEDIAAIFLRGLKSVSATVESQFAARLIDTYVGAEGAKAVVGRRSAEVLRIEPEKLNEEALKSRSMRGQAQPGLSVAALTYFLRDRIEAEIPALVDRLCPLARDGMKQADREVALNALDAEIAELTAQACSLAADIGAARAAVIR